MLASGDSVDGQLIVPVDLSHASWRVLPLAQDIGRQLGLPVVPVFVDTSTLGSHAVLDRSITLRADIDGEPVSIEVVPGADVAGTIRQLAAQYPRSVVVMSTRGLGGFAARAWGSVAYELLRSNETATVAVGPQFDASRCRHIRKVVACLDPSVPYDGTVQEAHEWAEALDVPMTIVAPTGGAPCQDSTRSAQRVLTAVAEQLGSARRRIDTEILDGTDAAAAIVRYLDHDPEAMLTVSALGQGLLTRRVVMTVARDAHCPIVLHDSARRTHVVPAQRTDESGRAGLTAPTGCHDVYDEPPPSTLTAPPTAGTDCHDDYAFEYTSLTGEGEDAG